jgi:Flp pilus assembly protein TadD
MAVSLPPEEQLTRLQHVSGLLREGRRTEAAAALRVLISFAPGLAEAHRLLGVALSELGDAAGAEAAYRTALKIEPAMARAATGLTDVLLSLDRSAEALEVIRPFVNDQTSNLTLLTFLGLALQGAGKGKEAVEVLTRASRAAPGNAAAEHNLASALGEVQSFAESEAMARQARARGLDAPELWLIWARAVGGQGRLEEAEALYIEAIRRRPTFEKAVAELAHTVWMRTGEREPTLGVFSQVFARSGPTIELLLQKAKLQDTMGDVGEAYRTLMDALAMRDDPIIHLNAAQLAVHLDTAAALLHADAALAAQPQNPAFIAAKCQVELALGHAEPAAALAETLCQRLPDDQYAIALLATAWRIMGDPRYGRLYDYDALVAKTQIETPKGWPNLETYLADLKEALQPLHHLRGHLAGQSARQGSQTQQDLTRAEHPAIRAFFKAIDRPIRRRIAHLGKGRDPLRRRATKAYDFNGVWSIRLQPNGFHANHLHARGWLSSACYIDLPPAVQTEPEGWLTFGEPGIPTSPHLPPERFVRPEPGALVLFPSYMWHGTVPFSGDQPRLTIAFDVVPA